MPRYFFHYTSPDCVLLDDVGVELENMGKAHEHAFQNVCEIAARLGWIWNWSGWVVDVTDESGRRVLIVPFPDPKTTPLLRRPNAVGRRLPGERPHPSPRRRADGDARHRGGARHVEEMLYRIDEGMAA